MLELIEVKKSYNKYRAVDGLSFSLNQGEILGLIGSNGAGKSTTISMIATLKTPDSGSIIYQGQDIVSNPEFMREHLGYVPQEIALYPSLSGWDNLKFWGRANNIRGAKLKARMEEISQMIHLSDEVLHKKVSSYSGGMKRLLNIGVALLHYPSIVIMDEPTVGLDVEARKYILDTVKYLKKSGTSIIYTGHYLDEIEEICDKICILDHGKCILFGEKSKLLVEGMSVEELYMKHIGKDSRK